VGLTATKFEAVLALTTLNKKNDIVNKVWNNDWRYVAQRFNLVGSHKEEVIWKQ
jgi:hypothetical protein